MPQSDIPSRMDASLHPFTNSQNRQLSPHRAKMQEGNWQGLAQDCSQNIPIALGKYFNMSFFQQSNNFFSFFSFLTSLSSSMLMFWAMYLQF
jgi:hypothetical protein